MSITDERKPDGGLQAWIDVLEAQAEGREDAELLMLLIELRRRRSGEHAMPVGLPPCPREPFYTQGQYTHGCVTFTCDQGHQHPTGKYVWDTPDAGNPHSHSITCDVVKGGE